MSLAADGNLLLGHSFQQRRLRFRRRAVDFVGQQHVGEDRAANELERPIARAAVFVHHVGARDVGRHQVGRELDAVEIQRQAFGQRADHQRLGQPRHSFENAVAAGEQADEQLLDDIFLPDDGAGHLLANRVACGAKSLEAGKVFGFNLGGHGEPVSCVRMSFLTLINRKILVRKLQDDQSDARAVSLPDAVAGPGTVAGLQLDQLIAGAGEIIVPVFVAGLIKGLGGVEMGVVGVPEVFFETSLCEDRTAC